MFLFIILVKFWDDLTLQNSWNDLQFGTDEILIYTATGGPLPFTLYSIRRNKTRTHYYCSICISIDALHVDRTDLNDSMRRTEEGYVFLYVFLKENWYFSISCLFMFIYTNKHVCPCSIIWQVQVILDIANSKEVHLISWMITN